MSLCTFKYKSVSLCSCVCSGLYVCMYVCMCRFLTVFGCLQVHVHAYMCGNRVNLIVLATHACLTAAVFNEFVS